MPSETTGRHSCFHYCHAASRRCTARRGSKEAIVIDTYYRQALEPQWSGRSSLLVGYHLAASQGVADAIYSLGDVRPFVIARGCVKSSDLRLRHIFPTFVFETADIDYLEQVRQYEQLLTHPTIALSRDLDQYDPRGSAIALGPTLGNVAHVAGRSLYAPRQPSWIALEDKAVVDRLWDECGVPRSRYVVLGVDDPSLWRVTEEMSTSLGAIWSGDAADGPNSNGEYVRWIDNRTDAESAARFFAQRCRQIRIMPFVEGVPCSIHGMVMSDGIAVFRPVEIATTHVAGSGRMHFGGCSTFWDPPFEGREEMRAVARRVGEHLMNTIGYRGAFGIDGIFTGTGFVPTEINTRFSGGLEVLADSCPDVPLQLIHWAAIASEDEAIESAVVEHDVLTSADKQRSGSVHCQTQHQISEEHSRNTSMGMLTFGPSIAGGGFIRLAIDPNTVAIGSSVASDAMKIIRQALIDMSAPDCHQIPLVDYHSNATA